MEVVEEKTPCKNCDKDTGWCCLTDGTCRCHHLLPDQNPPEPVALGSKKVRINYQAVETD